MVLLDDVPDRPGQPLLPGDLDALLDVVDDDQRAHARGQVLVDVLLAVLVLDEILRHLDLADVVVEGAGLDEERIELDGFGRLLGEGGDDERMMVGAGRLDGHLAEDLGLGVRQLEELRLGHEPEEVLVDREEDEGEGRAEQAPDAAHEDLGGELVHGRRGARG